MRKRSEFEGKLAEIFGSHKQLVDSQLVYLSNLTEGELASFKQVWVKVDKERKLQVIRHLLELSENNLALDFTKVFLSCLEDSDKDITVQAIVGLEGEEDSCVILPLVRLLRGGKTEEVRATAATALGQFAMLAELGKLSQEEAREVYSALLAVTEDEAESVEVRRRALEAIAPMDSPRVKQLIEQSYRSNNVKVKASALYAMGRNCDPAWLPIVIRERNNSEAEIRYEVAEACGEFGLEEVVPYLIELAQDRDIQVRGASIRALEEISGPEARQALGQLLNSSYQDVRQAAQEALAESEFQPYSFGVNSQQG